MSDNEQVHKKGTLKDSMEDASREVAQLPKWAADIARAMDPVSSTPKRSCCIPAHEWHDVESAAAAAAGMCSDCPMKEHEDTPVVTPLGNNPYAGRDLTREEREEFDRISMQGFRKREPSAVVCTHVNGVGFRCTKSEHCGARWCPLNPPRELDAELRRLGASEVVYAIEGGRLFGDDYNGVVLSEALYNRAKSIIEGYGDG